jgi:membrane-associated phospholipid phosphatase
MHGVRTAPAAPATGHTRQLVVLATAAAVLGAGMVVVRGGTVPALEEDVFRAINDLPDALYPVLWPVLQLGALLVGPLVAIVALGLRRPRLAIAAIAVIVLKLVGERAVKAVSSRQRPGTSIGPDIHDRGDVSLTGESFVSGHAVLVTALAVVVTPYLNGRWRAVPGVLAVGVAVGRVYVGAHNPLDVVCGAALGVIIGVIVDAVTRQARPREASPHADRARQ